MIRHLAEEVARIKAAHAQARPKPVNPAWCNSHHDCGVLLNYIDDRESYIKYLEKWIQRDKAND